MHVVKRCREPAEEARAGNPRRPRRRAPVVELALCAVGCAASLCAQPLAATDGSRYPEGVVNTQKPGDEPISPAEALARIRLPEGFRATLFAAEPDVAQPISLAFDERGRLWVAECYSYDKSGKTWQEKGRRDRILVFADRDGDGRFDERKVFAEGVLNLTSVLPGFGGVWACSAPELLFFPDRDRDDVPDSAPVVELDGWDDGKVGHNIFNSLTWAPDGWLWGTQGIQGDSRVGRPGTPPAARVRVNCGVWRYHPVRKLFEVVCEGTTNPWGLDFDDHGQAFITNCVIGHLWHVVPGAHYKRMYGSDSTPYTYELIEQCADHIHWAGGPWQEARGGEKHDVAGGGHAHAGAMVYLGDNWPAEYRGSILMSNLHGRRLNRDLFERRGSGYVGRHRPDFLRSEDPWFRAISILCGPDGGVVVSDWSDWGECHDNDGVHRTSGRIYKVVHGEARLAKHFDSGLDIAALEDYELVGLQLHSNEWLVRHARRVLQERAAAGRDLEGAHAALREILANNADETRRLRALWALWSSGGLAANDLIRLLDDASEHVRAWAVRFLCEDRDPPAAALARFAAMAREDSSALVRLFLASILQRLPLEKRWAIAEALAAHGEDAEDANIPLVLWYGIEPLAAADPARATALAARAKIPLVRRFIARRIAEKE